MEPTSIRAVVSLLGNPAKSTVINLCNKKICAPSSSTEVRNNKPSYRFCTSLLGRLVVALSGSAARRERACARFNTFVISNGNNPLLYQDIMYNIAANKILKVYNNSTDLQRQAMKAQLTEDAQVKFIDVLVMDFCYI